MSEIIYEVDIKKYLIKKIANHEKNGLTTLGELHAKHIDDICQVMAAFANDVVEAISKNCDEEPLKFNYDPTREAEDTP